MVSTRGTIGLVPNATSPARFPDSHSERVGDELDTAIVDQLRRNARTPNAVMATSLGVAPSTIHARLKALQERGVILGFHADVSLAAMGRPLQALIAIRLAAHTRDQIDDVRRTIPALPGVMAMFHGEFLLDHVTSQPGVAHAETSLIFEHVGAEDPFARR
jgi:hypothetical protein